MTVNSLVMALITNIKEVGFKLFFILGMAGVFQFQD